MTNQRWQVWLNALVGLAVLLMPWLLASADATAIGSGAEWSLWISGGLIIVLSLAAIMDYRTWEEWLSALIGAWLIASPWIFDYSAATAMTWSTVVAGAVLVVLGAWSAVTNPGTQRLA